MGDSQSDALRPSNGIVGGTTSGPPSSESSALVSSDPVLICGGGAGGAADAAAVVPGPIEGTDIAGFGVAAASAAAAATAAAAAAAAAAGSSSSAVAGGGVGAAGLRVGLTSLTFGGAIPVERTRVIRTSGSKRLTSSSTSPFIKAMSIVQASRFTLRG